MEKLILQISHAIFRVCSYIGQKDLKGRMEAHSVYLVELSYGASFDDISKTTNILESLVFLGEEIGEIQYYPGQILHQQFANLRRLILETQERKRVETAIEDIFSGNYDKYIKDTQSGNLADSAIKSANRQDSAIRKVSDISKQAAATSLVSENNNNETAHLSSGFDRQDQVADKIRQLGKAAMKDLIAAFPSVSERTLRYDLQKLSDRQIIERIGSGGPASYYTIKRSFMAKDLLS